MEAPEASGPVREPLQSAGACSLPSARPPSPAHPPTCCLPWADQVCSVMDGPPAPPSWRRAPGWQEEAPTGPLTDGRHVTAGNERVLGGRAFHASGSFVLTTPCTPQPGPVPPPPSSHLLRALNTLSAPVRTSAQAESGERNRGPPVLGDFLCDLQTKSEGRGPHRPPAPHNAERRSQAI